MCDLAAERRVPGAVHLAHAAGADRQRPHRHRVACRGSRMAGPIISWPSCILGCRCHGEATAPVVVRFSLGVRSRGAAVRPRRPEGRRSGAAIYAAGIRRPHLSSFGLSKANRRWCWPGSRKRSPAGEPPSASHSVRVATPFGVQRRAFRHQCRPVRRPTRRSRNHWESITRFSAIRRSPSQRLMASSTRTTFRVPLDVLHRHGWPDSLHRQAGEPRRAWENDSREARRARRSAPRLAIASSSAAIHRPHSTEPRLRRRTA